MRDSSEPEILKTSEQYREALATESRLVKEREALDRSIELARNRRAMLRDRLMREGTTVT